MSDVALLRGADLSTAADRAPATGPGSGLPEAGRGAQCPRGPDRRPVRHNVAMKAHSFRAVAAGSCRRAISDAGSPAVSESAQPQTMSAAINASCRAARTAFRKPLRDRGPMSSCASGAGAPACLGGTTPQKINVV